MKALTERLDWLRLYILESVPENIKDPAAYKQSIMDTWIECNAIAEALPEITLPDDFKPVRQPPERIIKL